MELLKQCTERIADEVERILQRTIPAFYAGIAANAGVGTPTREGTAAPVPMELTADESDGIPDEEIPWDYLGE